MPSSWPCSTSSVRDDKINVKLPVRVPVSHCHLQLHYCCMRRCRPRAVEDQCGPMVHGSRSNVGILQCFIMGGGERACRQRVWLRWLCVVAIASASDPGQ